MKIFQSLFLVFSAAVLLGSQSCGQRQGCTNSLAVNYDNDAEDNDGSCEFTRTFWDDSDSSGWIDVWVANFDTIGAPIVYEGRITTFYDDPPACAASGTVVVNRRPGLYYVEYENNRGNIYWEEVPFREESCRLYELDY